MSRAKCTTPEVSFDSLISRRGKAFYLVRVERFDVDHPSLNTVSLHPVRPSCHSGKWRRDGIKKETCCVWVVLEPETTFIQR